MTTQKRVLVASFAAAAGLFLAACDNTETEPTPETPAGTTTQPDEGAATGDVGGDTGEEGGANNPAPNNLSPEPVPDPSV